MADSNWNATIEGLLKEFFAAEAEAHNLKVRSDALGRQRSEAETKAKNAKAQLRDMLTEQGVMNESHPMADLIIAKGRESVKYEDSFDPKDLPIDYVKVERKADTTQIKAALARGETLPGVTLVTGQPSLRIKPKETANG